MYRFLQTGDGAKKTVTPVTLVTPSLNYAHHEHLLSE